MGPFYRRGGGGLDGDGTQALAAAENRNRADHEFVEKGHAPEGHFAIKRRRVARHGMLCATKGGEVMATQRNWRVEAGLLALVVAALAVSGWAPYDRATWLLEVFPVFVAGPLLLATRRRFPLTRLVYVLIGAHALILILGGAYTYARVPLGFWLQDVFHFHRNPYDRLGHLAQGFVPALAAREILLRLGVVRGRGWLFFLVSCVALAISACYEFVEWGAAVAFGQGAEEFLATQGDPWDTQSDMAMALIGALGAQVLLGRWQDRQIARLGS